MKIVFVASECVPFSKTGGLADVVGALPKALAKLSHEVDVLVPRYRNTPPGSVLPEARNLTLPLSSGFRFASVQLGKRSKNLRFCLVDCPEFFDREALYRERGADYPDNYLRFAGLCLAALEFMKRSEAPPSIIHCHDWQSALVPVYLRTLYRCDPFFQKTRVVLTIHNLAYQGLFPPDVLPQISIGWELYNHHVLEFYGKANLLKGGIALADFITTVSPTYAKEIQTKEYGCGLEGALRSRADRLVGILNGVDYDAWNPAKDKLIPARYTPSRLEGKTLCKKALLEKMGVANPALDRPTVGIISRFDPQKGFDLIAEVAEQMMNLELYVTALGTGEPEYEQLFRELAQKYPEKFLVRVAYDNELAHQIEAGADMFLMPSRYEPCGLNQIYSMKYGTVPVVRATGGLEDSVKAYDRSTREGTGFKFIPYTGAALLETLKEAIGLYHERDHWKQLIQNCMRQDFSWEQSARQYAKIYEELQSGEVEGAKTAAAAVASN